MQKEKEKEKEIDRPSCLICELEDLLPVCQQCRQVTVCLDCLSHLNNRCCPNCRMNPFYFTYRDRIVFSGFEDVPSENSLAYMLFSRALDSTSVAEIDLSSHPRNGQGYIDYIDEKMVLEPLSGGRDIYDRKFLTLNIQDTETREHLLLTIFQRNSNQTSFWIGSNFKQEVFDFSGGINSEQMLGIVKLMSGEKLQLDSQLRPRAEYFGKVLELGSNRQ